MTTPTAEGFFQNDDADTHCLQACYQMLVARLANQPLSMEAAEHETGFAEGNLTWQFEMLLSLADRHGLYVVDHELFDPHRFIVDPIGVIAAQIDDEAAVEHQLAHMDLEVEVERVKACLSHPRITFLNSLPSYGDLRTATAAGAHLVCAVNGALLDGSSGYRPHSVVVRAASETSLVIDDPGPPPRPGWEIATDLFVKAWTDPSPSVANYVACAIAPLSIITPS